MFYPISGTSSVNNFRDLTNGSTVTEDEFLKMLITQLQNQNPLNPQTSEEFVAQLTQFTSVEQLSNINNILLSSLKSNLQLINSLNNTSAIDLIDKNVKILNDSIIIDGDTQQFPISYRLNSNTEHVVISIKNARGKVIKNIELLDEFLEKGEHFDIIWDCTDNNGIRTPIGNYTIDILAINSYGELMNVDSFTTGKIQGIRYSEAGTPLLIINDSEYDISKILEVLSD